jgi:hypothetical protein
MSTKTNFKRIALVAVASVGMGLLSSVPAQATIDSAAAITATAGAGATLRASDSTTASTIAIRYFASGGNGAAITDDTATIQVSLGTKPTGSSLDSSSILMTLLDTATLGSGGVHTYTGKPTTTAWNGASGVMGTDSMTVATATGRMKASAVGWVYAKWGFWLDTASAKTAGTYTFDYVVRVYSGGVLDATKGSSGSVNYVVTDATVAAAGVVSAAGTTTAVMSTGSSYSPAVAGIDDVVTAVVTPSATTASAVIRVTQKTSDGSVSRESITVTTNIGNVGTTSAATGKSVTFVGDTDGIDDIGIFADGTSGVATITIKTTSVTFSSKQVTFYSTSVDKIVAVQLGNQIGGTAANVILAKAYDAAGNQIVNDTSVYAYSSNLDVIATGGTAAVPTGTACAYVASVSGQICSLAGSADGTAVVTLRNKSTAALSTKASNAITITVNNQVPVALKLAFDKATYAPGEAAYIRVWGVDAAGKVVAPATRTNLMTAAGITSTVAFGNGSETTTGSSPVTGFTTVAGNGYASADAIRLYKVYMPSSGGTVSISATGGTALPAGAQVEVKATATVTDSGAAALAAVTALATTVASLKTLITTLTNLVLKIQKKVKA